MVCGTNHTSTRSADFLHDNLWTGDIEKGLQKSLENTHRTSSDEIDRLPSMLRLLKTQEDDEVALEHLQDRAALYSVSEEIQVIASYLSPYVGRKHNKKAGSVTLNEQVGGSSSGFTIASNAMVADDLESQVTKVFDDMHQLVQLAAVAPKEELSLSSPDSSLAQPSVSNLVGGSSDLPATLASLMQFSTLSHRAVASALCRANFPQTPEMIFRLGANYPSAVPSLVLGCVEILNRCESMEMPIETISKTCTASLKLLAGLSPRERKTVLRKLRHSQVGRHLQLELLLENRDPTLLASFVRSHSNVLSGSRIADTIKSLLSAGSLPSIPEKPFLEAYIVVLCSADISDELDLSDWNNRLVSAFSKGRSHDIDLRRDVASVEALIIAVLVTAVHMEAESSISFLGSFFMEFCNGNNLAQRLMRTPEVLVNVISSKFDIRVHEMFVRRLNKSARRLAEAFSSLLETEDLCPLSVSVDEMAALDFEDKSNYARSKLELILHSENGSEMLVDDPDIVHFVQQACCELANSQSLPVVFPLALDCFSSKVHQLLRTSAPLDPSGAQYILRLLYCFSFADYQPDSPFRLDPYALPLKELYHVCKQRFPSVVGIYLLDRICCHAPETRLRWRSWNLQRHQKCLRYRMENPSKSELFQAIRKSLRKTQSDPDGTTAERTFSRASHLLPDVDLLTTTVSALVTSESATPTYITHSNIFRDPLLPLQCPLRTWIRPGLQRVVLYVLRRLLDVNTTLVMKTFDVSTGAQMLAARDVIVLRCLVNALTAASLRKVCDPSNLAINFVRVLISARCGLIAFLKKQGIDEVTTDWIVKYVPESFEHGADLVAVLSDPRTSLSAGERLVVAEGMLRIAVVHGHYNPGLSASMVCTALGQLLATFFLVIGPVGVPVSAVVSEEDGLDATQKSRKATFRMLSCLPHLRSSRTGVKSEYAVLLQKLISLCKSDSGGRQKILLKDIVDATVKAGNAIGVALQA